MYKLWMNESITLSFVIKCVTYSIPFFEFNITSIKNVGSCIFAHSWLSFHILFRVSIILTLPLSTKRFNNIYTVLFNKKDNIFNQVNIIPSMIELYFQEIRLILTSCCSERKKNITCLNYIFISWKQEYLSMYNYFVI